MKISQFAPIKFVKSVYEETLKVIWPTRQTVLRQTLAVIISVAVSAAFFALIDLAFQKLVVYSINNIQ